VTAADLLGKLTPEAAEKVAGTPLEHDLDKLERLARVVPEEQATVVRRHVTFEIPWEAAFEGLTLMSPLPVEGANPAEVVDVRMPVSVATGMEQPARPVAEPAEHSGPVPTRTKQIESWGIEKLKPNRFNAALFPDSLSDTSIALMADDLAKSGQRVAVEVTRDGTIVDGERRWRGATRLGWDDVEVLVGTDLTDDEILDRVIDACTSSRQMTVREQVNVFTAVTEQLRREAGRQQGRPEINNAERDYLTPRSIQEAAAKRAGFSSAKQAVRAEAIFTRGSPDQQAAVLDGSLAITAAYDKLPKRGKKKTTALATDESQTNVDRPDEDLGAPGDDNEAGQPLEASDVPQVAGPPEDDVRGDERENHEAGATRLVSEPEENAEQTPDIEEELAAPRLHVVEAEEQEEPDVTLHVNAICAHIIRLAEHDYDEAAIWLGDLVEQMRASLGERSDFEDVERPDAPIDDFDEL
jgi:hypothetical protein